MLYLPDPTIPQLEQYYNSLKSRVEAALRASALHNDAKVFLTAKKIKAILCDRPEKLLKHHEDIIPLLGVGFNLSDYNKYCTIKRKNAAARSLVEHDIFNRYDSEINKLTDVFDYDKFISKHKLTSYNLAAILNRNTCTYCNRLYTTTVVGKDETTHRINNSTRLTRPQFDHWYSKKKFGILALSYFNLIPSCSVCNSSIKGDTIFSLKNHLHPYIIEPTEIFSFNYKYKNVHKNNVEIIASANSKAEKTLKEFKIREVYDAHSEFELKDLLELRYKYSDDYIDTLFNKTFEIGISKKEAYRMIFGVEADEVDFHKRPFSKFKKDILVRLGVVL